MKLLDQLGLQYLIEKFKERFDLKQDTEEGKGLSTNDYTTAEKNKLSGIETGANNYTHPTSHPASMITESSTKRFVTDTEKTAWGNKWNYSEATIKAVKVTNAVNADNADTVNNKTVAVNVPSNAKFTDTIATKASLGLGNVTNDKQMPISGGVLENYREKLATVSASGGSINLSLGNVFQHTPSGNRTYSITNAVNGQAHSFTLMINMGSTVRTLTFPASVKWQSGEIPDLSTASKTYVLTFMTVDGGTNWFGMFGGEF